ncbi:hypothetical protein FRC05_003258 [Tulasnella sp. 425]|nr:hypothetical protein FRC05_003258 [Tulasnella sp. 425]
MKRPPTDIIDLTGEDDQKDVQIVSDSAKPPLRSIGKSSSRATSKSRDELDDNKPKAKKRRKMNGEEVDAADSGRSRGPSRASSKAPASSKGKAASSQPAESVYVVAPEPKASEGPTISVGAENVDFFIDTHGDQSLQPNGAASNQITAEVPPAEENAGPSQEPKTSVDQNPSVNGRVVVPAPKKRSKSKTPKSQPQSADGSELSTAGTTTPPRLPDIEEEGAGQPESNADKAKQLSKTAAKKARRRERERLAAESAAGAGGQAQDIPLHALPSDGGSPPPFFEDVEGITVAGHLQPDPIEEPLPAFVTVDGLTLPRHVKLAKEDAKTKADDGAEHGNSDESSSEESDTDIESDDDDDRPKKGRRYWLTQEQLAAIPPCGVCGEQGHDFRDCTHLKCTQCGALDDHESNKCPLFVTCWKCGEKGHVSVSHIYSMNRNVDQLRTAVTVIIAGRGIIWPSIAIHFGERIPTFNLRIAMLQLQVDVRLKEYHYFREARDIWAPRGGVASAEIRAILDCDNLDHPLRKKGPMAFSDELLRKGPFASARPYLSRNNHDPTTNGVHTYFSDVPGPSMPTNPGAQGKKKQQQQMQKARRNDDEGDDWFDRRENRAASSSKSKPIDIEIRGFREREDARRKREEAEMKRRVDDERRRRDRSRERYRDDERDSYRSRDQDYRRRDHDREYYDSRRERLDDGRRGHDRYYDDRRSGRRERSPPRKGKSLIDRMSINLSRR